jgi:peroxiredoxin
VGKLLKVLLGILSIPVLLSWLAIASCSPNNIPTPASTYQLEVSLPGEEQLFPIDGQGVLISNLELSSADGEISLSLDKGTALLDKDGEPLQFIHGQITPSPPPSPEEAYIVSPVFNLEPQGATFDPRLLLTLSYHPQELPEGLADSDLYIAYYSGNDWCKVRYRKPDDQPHSVTTHLCDLNFTNFAILGPKLTPPTHQPSTGTSVGDLAPDFELPDLDGQSVSLSGLRGKPVLINFWSTGCPPCRDEMPYLQEIYDEWSGTELALLAINIGDSPAKVEEFMQGYSFTLPVLLDTSQGVALKYNIRYIPTTFLIDREGIIQTTRVGAFSNKGEIEELLTKITP